MTGDADGRPVAEQMWETVPRLLALHRYLVLATADAAGSPWASPVFYAADGEHRLLWVSSPDSRHSRNIAERPEVAITVFDTDAPIGRAEALYLESTAGPVADDALSPAVALLNSRLPARQHLTADDLTPAGPLRVYEARVRQHHVLVRGGDVRFDNVTDARLAVRPP
jgi:uncharacterized protein YhbP (UPF0306 family)